MAGIKEKLGEIKAVEDTLTLNKVARFAYTNEAYETNDANGVSDYDVNRQQNIPVANADILKVNETILSKGYRTQASSITRMLMNHFLGRISYNLNKLNDNMSDLLSGLSDSLGKPEGIATLDTEGRIPYSQLPESAMEYKGTWDASTNTPPLADGTGDTGDFYYVSVAGTHDFGSGEINFSEGDRIIYDGTVWQKLSGGSVKSVNGVEPDGEGNITLDTFGTIEVTQGNITNIKGDYIWARSYAGNTTNFSDGRYQTLNVEQGLKLNGTPIENFLEGNVKSVNEVEPDASGNVTLDTFGTLNVTDELTLKGKSVGEILESNVKSVNDKTPDGKGNVTLNTFGTLNVTNKLNLKGVSVEDLIKRAVNSLAVSNWTVIDNMLGKSMPQINGVAYDGSGRWIAVGSSGEAAYSDDEGGTWTRIPDVGFGISTIKAVAYANNRWIAVGVSGKISWSGNSGGAWTSISSSPLPGVTLNSIAYGNGRWITVGSNGKAAYSANNGEKWKTLSISAFGSTHAINSIAYGDGNWIAVGDNRRAAYSKDNGNTWTKINNMPFSASEGLLSIAYGGGRWIVTSDSGDGAYAELNHEDTWTAISDMKLSTEAINTIAYGKSVWVAGSIGRLTYSVDKGKTWTTVPFPAINSVIYSIGYGNNKFIAAGGINRASRSLSIPET